MRSSRKYPWDPPEKSPEAKLLGADNGYSYQNVLGKLIYVNMICCLDIEYVIRFLAWFSEAPNEEHYKALKQVCQNLLATKSCGILYQSWQSSWCASWIGSERLKSTSVSNLWAWPPHWIFWCCPCQRSQDLEIRYWVFTHSLQGRHCLEELYPTCCHHQLDQGRVLG